MGCIVGSLASSVACCCCSSAASLCCACLPSCKSSTSSKIAYSALLLLGTIASAIALLPGIRGLLDKIPALCSSYKMGIIDTGYKSGLDCDLITGFGAVYRICFGMTMFFLFFALVMIRVRSSRDPRSKLQNGFWFFKILAMLGLIVGAFFIPSGAFTTTWMVIGMIGGFLFILIQLGCIVDFAHNWAERWVDAFEEEDSRPHYVGLIFFTLFFYAVAFAGVVCFYVFYASDAVCTINKFFVSFNLILCVIVSVIAVLPAVQERLPRSGLLQASIITIYTMFLTWSAMTNEADKRCNPSLFPSKENLTVGPTPETREHMNLKFDWQTIFGLLFFIGTVIYSVQRTSGSFSVQDDNTILTEAADGGEVKEIQPGDQGQRVWDDESEAVTYNYSLYHLLLAAASLYVMMTLTNWYSPSSDLRTLYANEASTWVKISSSWVCLVLYVWSLLAPVIFPDRDFE